MELRPIGVVRSPYKTVLDAPRQGAFADAEAVLDVDPVYADGLEGVDALDRLLVVWWAHEGDRATLRRPGSDGVFTMRTPHRPNPICLSVVDLVRREGTRLVVRRLEAVDGTPILDLKRADAEFEGWTALPRELP